MQKKAIYTKDPVKWVLSLLVVTVTSLTLTSPRLVISALT